MMTCSSVLGHLHCPYGNGTAFLCKYPTSKNKLDKVSCLSFGRLVQTHSQNSLSSVDFQQDTSLDKNTGGCGDNFH